MSKACELCADRREVSTALARYRGTGYRTIDRCRDHVGCRQRVEFVGQEWPLESASEAERRLVPSAGR